MSRPRPFATRLARGNVLIGTIHLPPLPGSPRVDARFTADAFLGRVHTEARTFAEAGFDALLVENFGDAPFLKGSLEPHVAGFLAVAAREARLVSGLPVGVNALRNDARTALGACVASGGAFVRINVHTGVAVTDQGIIEGNAAETLRYRMSLSSTGVLLLADVHVKHAAPLVARSPAHETEEIFDRGLADAVVVTGPTTGRPPVAADLELVLAAACDRPVLIGSGATSQNASVLLRQASGIIVSSALRRGGRAGAPLDRRRVEAFVRAARPA